MNERVQALVVGGGPAGLASTVLLAQAGFDVVCVAPHGAVDPRTTALMAPSLRLLSHVGVWTDAVQQNCAPLKNLHILDDTGHLVSAPDLRFSAEEAGLEAFGWNVPVQVLTAALIERAKTLGGQLVDGVAASARCDENAVSVTLTDGTIIQGAFAVAAEGRKSVLREAASIGAEEWEFEQSALVTRFAHSRSHENTSTEWHKVGGPFTTVPLPGRRSALVWMDKPARIAALMAFSPKDLAREIQLENHGSLGLISDVEAPHGFAMRGVRAEHFAARRVYLVGEAAHVFPPVGAQGLNMTLRDAGHMVDVATSHADAGGNAAMFAYQQRRQVDVLPRQTAINMVNRSLIAESLGPHMLRAAGLAATAYVAPLRGLVVREGLSPSQGLPSAMRAL
jgi:2-octaprenyl-6-methoxyphenol hydroxylase